MMLFLHGLWKNKISRRELLIWNLTGDMRALGLWEVPKRKTLEKWRRLRGRLRVSIFDWEIQNSVRFWNLRESRVCAYAYNFCVSLPLLLLNEIAFTEIKTQHLTLFLKIDRKPGSVIISSSRWHGSFSQGVISSSVLIENNQIMENPIDLEKKMKFKKYWKFLYLNDRFMIKSKMNFVKKHMWIVSERKKFLILRQKSEEKIRTVLSSQ